MKNLLAALLFFTRLPLWRLVHVDSKHFCHVIHYWPIVGWLTASVMALTLWISAQIFPYLVAIILAVAARMWLTGALHEDGLADFFDGFGGSHSRVRILAIMKDSHIGTYGVLALSLYLLIMVCSLYEMPFKIAIVTILCADPFSKLAVSFITQILPYARTEQDSKAKVVYSSYPWAKKVVFVALVLIPALWMLAPSLWFAFVATILMLVALISWIKKRLGGYTGDCCGALFLLCELTFILSVLALLNKA